MKKYINTVFAASLIVGLFGCGKEERVAIQPSSNMASSDGVLKNTNTPPASPPQATELDTKYPLEKYSYIDFEDKKGDLAYIYYALADLPVDERALYAFSSAYSNEQDVFKKRDMELSEKQRIVAEIEKHKSMRYLALKTGIGWTLGSYDFNRKAFPISGGAMPGECLMNGKAASGINYRYKINNGICYYYPNNDELARRIEGARTSGAASFEFYVYAYANGVSNGAMDLIPIGVRTIIKDRKSGEEMADILTKIE